MTGWPTADGSGEEVRVVSVPARATLWDVEPDDPVKSMSSP
ncbi:hypothetical protein [Streptomyces sp. NPDC040750]